jgi:group I intron endonuclease
MASKSLVEKILKEQTNYYSDGYFENDGYCVYMFENLTNDKKYIGKTKNFKKRLQTHLYDMNDVDFVIYRAINKYGIEKFKILILEKCKDEHLSLEREKYYINLYQTNISKHTPCYGYNMTDGGEGIIGYKRTITDNEKVHKKLTANDVKNIYAKFMRGTKVSELLKEYKVSKGTINRVLRGDTWKDLDLKKIKRKSGAQLNENIVFEIYSTFINENITITNLAIKYNVERSTIHRILIGKTWKNLNLDIELSSKLIKERDFLDKSKRSSRDKNIHSKLSLDKVLEIRELWKTNEYSKSLLSKLFNVSRRAIKLVVENKSWKNI